MHWKNPQIRSTSDWLGMPRLLCISSDQELSRHEPRDLQHSNVYKANIKRTIWPANLDGNCCKAQIAFQFYILAANAFA